MSVKQLKFKQAEIVLTQACSLRCNFCFEKEWGYHVEKTISFKNLKKLVDFCNDAGVEYLFLSGGEPLLYPYLIDILKYIQSKGYPMKPTIATSGIQLADDGFAEELVKCGITYIDISLKGSNVEEWKNTTGYDGYDRQMLAIKKVSTLPVDFTCSMVVTMENVQHVCDAVQMALKNGGRQFSFTFIIDNDSTQTDVVEYSMSHNPQKLISKFLTYKDRLDAITPDWWIEYSFPLCTYTTKQLKELHGKLAAPCQVHTQDAITFSPSMDLLSCDMFMNKSLGRMGTDFHTFNEFLTWRSHVQYQEEIRNLQRLPSDKCAICTYYSYCYGGCPVLWKRYSFSEIQSNQDG